jgi:hypothetical protein
MNSEVFEKVKNQDIGNGQFFTIEARTQSGFSAEAKRNNCFKVSKFQSHVFVKDFKTLVNTSTGMQEINAVYNPEQESLYIPIAHNGLLAVLKSNPSKQYIRCMFTEKTAKAEVHFYNSKGEEIPAEECLTKSALEKFRHEKDFRDMSKSEKIAEISQTAIRYFSWENITYLSINGEKYSVLLNIV